MNECKALPSTTTASREANVKWPVAASYPPVSCTVDPLETSSGVGRKLTICRRHSWSAPPESTSQEGQ